MRERNFTTTVDRSKLLNALRKNRDNHAGMCAEARAGFAAEAKRVFADRIKAIESGNLTKLSIRLEPPEDHTAEYNTAIQMAEWSTENTITLTSDEFRNFVMDEWDWLGLWLVQNRNYSASTNEYAEKKSHLVE